MSDCRSDPAAVTDPAASVRPSTPSKVTPASTADVECAPAITLPRATAVLSMLLSACMSDVAAAAAAAAVTALAVAAALAGLVTALPPAAAAAA